MTNQTVLAPLAAVAVVASLLAGEVAAEAATHKAHKHHAKHHRKRHKHKRKHKATKAKTTTAAAPAPRSTTTCTKSASYEAGTVGPFEQHFYAAHLQRSPTEQVQDASDASTYAKVHTALVQAMIEPTLSAGDESTVVLQQSLAAFVAHLDAAHLEQSPSQQVAALMDPSTYTLSHTVLVEQMLKPVLDWVSELMAGKETCTTTTEPGSAPAPSAAPKAIDISGHMFMPQDVTVPVGTQVTWTNDDSEAHNVVADGGAFKSKTLNKGQSFSYSFPSAGTFAYSCSIHPDMRGKVTVR